MPGWDDERSTCMADVSKPAPDILYVNSFNEWVEGHHIEPSAQFGDLYLRLTGDFAARFKQGS
ncbi:MAG: glycoside hydrolase family 99-like domain-containing protein [Anaerolineae bacterium]